MSCASIACFCRSLIPCKVSKFIMLISSRTAKKQAGPDAVWISHYNRKANMYNDDDYGILCGLILYVPYGLGHTVHTFGLDRFSVPWFEMDSDFKCNRFHQELQDSSCFLSSLHILSNHTVSQSFSLDLICFISRVAMITKT